MSIAQSAAQAVDRPVAAVMSFSGFLIAIGSVLGFAQLRWNIFTANEFAMLGPFVTFVAAVVWLPLRGLLGWLARRFPESAVE